MTVVEVDTGAGLVVASYEGEGPDLLALHGGPGLSDYMGLLDAETVGWRVIRYQQRGVAPSTTEGPFTISRHVADAIAVLDACEVDRVSWSGTPGAAIWRCTWPLRTASGSAPWS